jgi:hypothetical protein
MANSQKHFPFPAERNLPHLVGQPGTKISLIVRHIKYLGEQSTTEPFKCLVFSQWETLLDILATCLQQNEIGFVRFTTKQDRLQSLSKFNTDPAVQVFMLNARSQSAGLTLTQATHVFLMEPSVHPSVEWQAVGRVHRMGQNRETWVHHYICDDTIEEWIYEMNRKAAIGWSEGNGDDDDDDASRQHVHQQEGMASKRGAVAEIVADSAVRSILIQEAARIDPQVRQLFTISTTEQDGSDEQRQRQVNQTVSSGRKRKQTAPQRIV